MDVIYFGSRVLLASWQFQPLDSQCEDPTKEMPNFVQILVSCRLVLLQTLHQVFVCHQGKV